MNIRDREITTTCDLLDLVRERPAMRIGLGRCPSFEDEQPHFYDFHAWIAGRIELDAFRGR